jgi:hypothetical protein
MRFLRSGRGCRPDRILLSRPVSREKPEEPYRQVDDDDVVKIQAFIQGTADAVRPK